jgi:hypothetical protein
MWLSPIKRNIGMVMVCNTLHLGWKWGSLSRLLELIDSGVMKASLPRTKNCKSGSHFGSSDMYIDSI